MDMTQKSHVANIATTLQLPTRAIRRTVIAAACCIFLLLPGSFALALEELGAVQIIEPLDGPGFRAVGWQWHYIDQNGKAGHMTKLASSTDSAGNELASYERTDG